MLSMNQKYRDKAVNFAKGWGWDGVMPTDFPLSATEGIPDGYEGYTAAFYNADAKTAKWTVMFDGTPHIIIANENEVRWRTKEDAVDMNY